MKEPLNASSGVGQIGPVVRIAVTESMTYKSGLELGILSSPFLFPFMHGY